MNIYPQWSLYWVHMYKCFFFLPRGTEMGLPILTAFPTVCLVDLLSSSVKKVNIVGKRCGHPWSRFSCSSDIRN